MKKNESTVVYGEEKQAVAVDKKVLNPFEGKATRLDGKPVDSSKIPMNKPMTQRPTKEEKEYDPRKHKLQNGVVY